MTLEPLLILYVIATGKTRGFVIVMPGAVEFWQTVVVPLIEAVGVGRTITVVEAKTDGPPHPLAVTLIVAIPEKAGAHVTVPVVPVPDMLFPVPDTVQL